MSTKKKPTRRQIEQEIAKLYELREKVSPFTFFGESNKDAIDAQIEVLQNNMTEDKAYGAYAQLDDDGEFADTTRELDSALDAMRWREGETDEVPSEGWKELVKE